MEMGSGRRNPGGWVVTSGFRLGQHAQCARCPGRQDNSSGLTHTRAACEDIASLLWTLDCPVLAHNNFTRLKHWEKATHGSISLIKPHTAV